jgi:hypothetical protein
VFIVASEVVAIVALLLEEDATWMRAWVFLAIVGMLGGIASFAMRPSSPDEPTYHDRRDFERIGEELDRLRRDEADVDLDQLTRVEIEYARLRERIGLPPWKPSAPPKRERAADEASGRAEATDETNGF